MAISSFTANYILGVILGVVVISLHNAFCFCHVFSILAVEFFCAFQVTIDYIRLRVS